MNGNTLSYMIWVTVQPAMAQWQFDNIQAKTVPAFQGKKFQYAVGMIYFPLDKNAYFWFCLNVIKSISKMFSFDWIFFLNGTIGLILDFLFDYLRNNNKRLLTLARAFWLQNDFLKHLVISQYIHTTDGILYILFTKYIDIQKESCQAALWKAINMAILHHPNKSLGQKTCCIVQHQLWAL